MLLYGIILTLIIYQAPFVYETLGGHFDGKTLPTFIFIGSYALIVFLIIPAWICQYIFRANLKEYGLRKPKPNYWWLLSIIAISIILPVLYHFKDIKHFQTYYTYSEFYLPSFIFMQFCVMPLYYLAEEFFFRGFLFLGLWQRVGWHSFWMTDIIFTLAHINKPFGEIVLSIFVSIIFNFITLYSRSIYPAFILHLSMGLFFNFLLNLNNLDKIFSPLITRF